MQAAILSHLNNPGQLEKLYHSDKQNFKNSIQLLYTEYKHEPIIQFWHERLHYNESINKVGTNKDFWTAIKLIIIAGLVANISNIPGVNENLFFSRNLSFVIIPFMAAYFIWKQNISVTIKITLASLFVFAALYVNFLPNEHNKSSVELALIHLPLFLWCVFGYAYLGNDLYNNEKRIQFLKFNSDLLVISVVLLLSGMLFSVVTFGLFELIGINIGNIYFKYIAIWGIGGIPIMGTYLIHNNPQIINKVTPIIAKIFTPLVFINLSVYLITLMYKGRYPYQDRNLLLIYNALLVGVLALIFFSIAENEKSKNKFYNALLLFGLCVLTVIINTIALSAITYRLFEYGITPNRIAVLGGNIIIFINLLLVGYKLILVLFKKSTLSEVENSIAKYLPIYAIWTGFVAFLIPLLFGFK
jgi:hypothetical protein